MAKYEKHTKLEEARVDVAGRARKLDIIDTPVEAEVVISYGETAAITDVKEDINNNSEISGIDNIKREIEAAEKVIKRVSARYLETVKRDEKDLDKKITAYFDELVGIIGDSNNTKPELFDYRVEDPLKIWTGKGQTERLGWYEEAFDKTARKTKHKLGAQKEETKGMEDKRFKPLISKWMRPAGGSNKIKPGSEEDFTEWLEFNRDFLRRAILKPLSENVYIIDLSGFSERYRKFFYTNLCLSDLFRDLSTVVTTWNNAGKRKSGLLDKTKTRGTSKFKGGYYFDGGEKRLEFGQNTIVSLRVEDREKRYKAEPVPKKWEPSTELDSRKAYSGEIPYTPTYNEYITPEDRRKHVKENTDLLPRRKILETNKLTEKFEIQNPKSGQPIVFELTTDSVDKFEEYQKFEYKTNAEAGDEHFANIVISIPAFSTDTVLIWQKDRKGNLHYYEVGATEKVAAVAPVSLIDNVKTLLEKLIRQQEKSPNKSKSIPKTEELHIIFEDVTSDTAAAQLKMLNLTRKKYLIEDKNSGVTLELTKEGDEDSLLAIKNMTVTNENAADIKAFMDIVDDIPGDQTRKLIFRDCTVKFTDAGLTTLMEGWAGKSIVLEGSRIHPEAMEAIGKAKTKGLSLSGALFSTKHENLVKFQENDRLVKLDLSRSGIIDDNVIRKFFTNLQGDPICFPQLRILDLSDTAITDEALDYIDTEICPNLDKVNLNNTGVSKNSIQTFSGKFENRVGKKIKVIWNGDVYKWVVTKDAQGKTKTKFIKHSDSKLNPKTAFNTTQGELPSTSIEIDESIDSTTVVFETIYADEVRSLLAAKKDQLSTLEDAIKKEAKNHEGFKKLQTQLEKLKAKNKTIRDKLALEYLWVPSDWYPNGYLILENNKSSKEYNVKNKQIVGNKPKVRARLKAFLEEQDVTGITDSSEAIIEKYAYELIIKFVGEEDNWVNPLTLIDANFDKIMPIIRDDLEPPFKAVPATALRKQLRVALKNVEAEKKEFVKQISANIEAAQRLEAKFHQTAMSDAGSEQLESLISTLSEIETPLTDDKISLFKIGEGNITTFDELGDDAFSYTTKDETVHTITIHDSFLYQKDDDTSYTNYDPALFLIDGNLYLQTKEKEYKNLAIKNNQLYQVSNTDLDPSDVAPPEQGGYGIGESIRGHQDNIDKITIVLTGKLNKAWLGLSILAKGPKKFLEEDGEKAFTAMKAYIEENWETDLDKRTTLEGLDNAIRDIEALEVNDNGHIVFKGIKDENENGQYSYFQAFLCRREGYVEKIEETDEEDNKTITYSEVTKGKLPGLSKWLLKKIKPYRDQLAYDLDSENNPPETRIRTLIENLNNKTGVEVYSELDIAGVERFRKNSTYETICKHIISNKPAKGIELAKNKLGEKNISLDNIVPIIYYENKSECGARIETGSSTYEARIHHSWSAEKIANTILEATEKDMEILENL